jgi:conjugative transfer signal peptidase TraF
MRCHCVLAATFLGLAAVVAPVIQASPKRLVWNASASLPVGLYVAQPSSRLKRGDIILIRLPSEVRSFAASRGYVPASVPVLKRMVGRAGDTICREGEAVTVAGFTIVAKKQDRLSRPLPRWNGCRVIRRGELALLAEAADSFDSRYFGAVPESGLVAIVRPLWVRP